MKKKKSLLLILCLVFSLFACSSAGEESTAANLENTAEKTAELTPKNLAKNQVRYFIGPKLVDCIGLAPQKCLEVKKQESDDWLLFYSTIEDFTFEEGYNYEVLLETEKIANPPMDSSSIRYKLLNIISKTPAQ